MTSIATTDFQVGPRTAADAVCLQRTRTVRRSPFCEVRVTHRQHMLQVAAVTTGILCVTVAAAATIVLTIAP